MNMDSDLKDMSKEPLSPRRDTNLEDHPATKDQPSTSTSDVASTSHSDSNNIQELEQKYAAFVRHDMYGTMGRGPLPWTQKIITGFALITLFPLRLVLATLVVVLYYLICKACTLFAVPKREDEQEDYAHIGGWRRKVIFWFGRVLGRALLFVFGFYWINETYRNPDIDSKFDHELEVTEKSEESDRPGAIISNHVSHLDILYHMSSSFPSFVAKRSVGKLPLVGLISKCLGCIYVQRESKSADFKGVSGVVNDRINESRQDKSAPMVMLFPEGTTTNGDYILPFKTGAFLSKAPVLPVILRYPYKRFSPAWDTISGRRHVILLLCQFVNNITVVRLPLYHPSQEEKENPKLYAENVRRLMAREGDLKMSDIGLPEKRVYHAAVHGTPTVLHQKAD
ncbi:putative plasmalogen synthase [Helianthus annuus]|uniref:Plasmalogen synthase n=1 Tax=Helianthus annuus TaxID=4232 RepID=A0A251U010_HELAN|nr:lysophospholipid acyltransferase LPEAT1 isoform X1 [Helianthus annuus]KAF5792458.1 putative plasmalogen synthase [Helianthus annuus]KAJ0894716.1 putative plasmalogen synthase [Helianthus annuus]